MRTKHFMTMAVIVAGFAVPAVAKLETPKIDKATATVTALAAVLGGMVQDGELEREHGRLIYSLILLCPARRVSRKSQSTPIAANSWERLTRRRQL